MEKNRKIGLFFGAVATLVVLSVVVSAWIATTQIKQTIAELVERQNIFDETAVDSLVGELEIAGYDIYNTEYSQIEMQRIAHRMSKNPAYSQEQWEEVANMIRLYSEKDYDELDQRACSHINRGVIWDSRPYDQCSKTCSGSGACNACCNAAGAVGDYSGEEVGWCMRHCRDNGAVDPAP